jgi:hypothetical protein
MRDRGKMFGAGRWDLAARLAYDLVPMWRRGIGRYSGGTEEVPPRV